MKESLKEQIRRAFADVTYPGDWCLRDSYEGDEPELVEEVFKGKSDWTQLDASFLDDAPDGWASALSFLSVEGFRFYLPAYLIADIDGLLHRADPLFKLTHGLEMGSAKELVNPLRYGERTWWDARRYQFSRCSRRHSAPPFWATCGSCTSTPWTGT